MGLTDDPQQRMDPLTSTLRALADPTRCTILELLLAGSHPVSDLAGHFSISRPAISKHLLILREAGLVSSRRVGRQQIYQLDAAPLEQVRGWLARFDAGGNEPRRAARRCGVRRPATGRDDWRSW